MLTTDKTDGALPLTVKFTSARLAATRIRATRSATSGTSATARRSPPRPTRPTPTPRPAATTPILTVFDSSGQKTATSTIITAGNTTPTVQVIAPRSGGLFSFGDTIQYKVDGHRSRGVVDQLQRRPGDVRARSRLARPRRADQHRLHRLPADDRVRRLPRRQRVRRHQRVSTPTRAASGGQAPSLTGFAQNHDPPEAPGGRVRRQPVRHDDGDQHRHGGSRACTATASARATGCSSTGRSTCSRSTRSRSATPTAPRAARPGPALAAVDLRQDSITGPVVATANLDFDRRHRQLGDHDGAAHERRRAARTSCS